MSRQILTFLLLLYVSICNGQNNLERLEEKAKNNQIPEKWNMEMFVRDQERFKEEKTKPFNSSAFPVEKYDYYVFSKPFNFQLNNMHFSGIAFGENKKNSNGKYEKKHELAIIFYTGNKNYQLEGSVSSRNYPYLTVQGQVELNNPYDYFGVKSPDNSGYIVINLKTFDLRFGQTVMIFPNKDNSFYYLQFDKKPQSDKKFAAFISELKKDNRIPEMIKLLNK
ncbi:MAG: hypothetical protein ACEPOZ_07125 [Marinifilaceae bacterium]